MAPDTVLFNALELSQPLEINLKYLLNVKKGSHRINKYNSISAPHVFVFIMHLRSEQMFINHQELFSQDINNLRGRLFIFMLNMDRYRKQVKLKICAKLNFVVSFAL